MEVCSLKGLRKLSLADNSLTELPPQIGRLLSLVWLSFARNRLVSLPEAAFASLIELKVLHLESNLIASFPLSLLRLKKLSVLDMSDNAISSVPALELISSCTINKLDLRGNKEIERQDGSLPWRDLHFVMV